jgi:hypothetical protein
MGTEFWLQLIITVGSIAALGGGIMARLSILEKKVDKHNCFMERLAVVETKINSIEKED